MSRPSRKELFMRIALELSKRSTCVRAKVGCLLVQENRIIASGYNGSPPDHPHCIDIGCVMDSGHCVRSLHAEENALIQCAITGVRIQNAKLFCTHEPCLGCTRRLYAASVREFYFLKKYESMSAADHRRIAFYQREGLSIFKVELDKII